jgi:hypothetical protein
LRTSVELSRVYWSSIWWTSFQKIGTLILQPFWSERRSFKP